MNLSLRLLTVFLLYAGLAQAQYIVVIPVSPSQVCAGGSVTVNYYPDSNVPTYTVTNVQLVGADNTVISPPSYLINSPSFRSVTVQMPTDVATTTTYRVRLTVDWVYSKPGIGTSKGTLTGTSDAFTVKPLPGPPAVTDVAFCQGTDQTTALNAIFSSASGTNLKWYNTDNQLITTWPAPIQSTTVYVSQTTDGCESPKAPLRINVKDRSAKPTAPSSVVAYQGGSFESYTIDGQNLRWYTAPTATEGETASITISPSTATVGSTTYYVSQTPDGKCESDRTAVTFVVKEAPSATLSVSSYDGDKNQPTNSLIRPYFQINNEGPAGVPLSEITVRYWFTSENFSPLTNLQLSWAKLGTDKVHLHYVALPADQPRQGALGYVEYRFDASAGNLAPHSNSGGIFSQLAKQDWSAFNESDDYSYLNATSPTPNPRMTVYRNGVLVGGQEPPLVTPVQSLNVLVDNRNLSASTSIISTYVQVVNAGNTPVAYGDLKVRYWFTAETAPRQALAFYLDWAKQVGNTVSGQFVEVARQGADTYLELSFAPSLGNLAPLSNTGNVQYRIGKKDGTVFNQLNDYSYQAAGGLMEAPRVTLYLGNQLVWGTEPASGARQIGSETAPQALEVVLLGNPVRGDEVAVAVQGTGGQSLRLELVDGNGRLISERVLERTVASEHQRLGLNGQPAGVYVLRVSGPAGAKTLKVVKAQ